MANGIGLNTYTDLATVLNDIHSIVIGSEQIAPINTNQFVNVATTLLQVGYDPLLQAISQVLTRTIFSVRPYYRKFRDLETDNMQWGNHVRKLQMLDGTWDDDVTYNLVDGQAVDMYKVKKDAILQTNFYGINNFNRYVTIYKHQLDTAFSTPEEFGRFLSMKLQNISDQIEQTFESVARLVVANYMAGMTLATSGNVIHLVTEYNSYLGLSSTEAFTAETIKLPDNWKDFVYWAFARMAGVSDMLTERTTLFHQQLPTNTGAKSGTLVRHTPKALQRAYFLNPEMYMITGRVFPGTFNTSWIQQVPHEGINFWQSPESPSQIQVVPSYTSPTDGSIKIADATVTLADVFGIIFDREAMGATMVNQETGPTPYNIAGSYSNLYFKYAYKWYNDWTENAVLFLLD